MANHDQLEILQRGVDHWNRWRAFHSDGTPRHYTSKIEPDLRGWDGGFLREFDFHGRFLPQYVPHPSELREVHEAFARGTLSPDLIPYGWRYLNEIDLTFADLSNSDLSRLTLWRGRLYMANLAAAKLSGTNLADADLRDANLVGALLDGAHLPGANLSGANLMNACLARADLRRCNFSGANLQGANVQGANLEGATCVGTNIDSADLSDSRVYGLSVWDLKAGSALQRNLIITKHGQPQVTVDDLEMAQFVYLILNNKAIRSAIDTLTTKVVLILGRFTPERKAILGALRDVIRRSNYLPVLFDFEASENRDLTETVSLLAHLARFVIADLTDAKSIPQELQRIVPNLPSVPVQPILQDDSDAYAMFEHLRRYPWVLPMQKYSKDEVTSEHGLTRFLVAAEAASLRTASRAP